MKTARQYAEDAVQAVGRYTDRDGEIDESSAAKAILIEIPLDELLECVKAGKHMLSTKPKSRDRIAAMAGLIHALADFDRKAGK